MSNKILWIAPYSGGYKNITNQNMLSLAANGFEMFVLALDYKSWEHDYPFDVHIIPTETSTLLQQARLLLGFMDFKAVVFAMDIIQIGSLVNSLIDHTKNAKLISITPLESPPLPEYWAKDLMLFDKRYVFTKFAQFEFAKKGLQSSIMEYVSLPEFHAEDVDREATLQADARKHFNLPLDRKIVLTVAANQERKNWIAMMDTIKKSKLNPLYVGVTSDFVYGYNLTDYAREVGIDYLQMSGLSDEDLAKLYRAADAFLLLSKAEGLGIPVIDANTIGLPVVGIDACAIAEFCREYRVPVEYSYRDVFGHGWRYFPDTDTAAELLDLAVQAGHSPSKFYNTGMISPIVEYLNEN